MLNIHIQSCVSVWCFFLMYSMHVPRQKTENSKQILIPVNSGCYLVVLHQLPRRFWLKMTLLWKLFLQNSIGDLTYGWIIEKNGNSCFILFNYNFSWNQQRIPFLVRWVVPISFIPLWLVSLISYYTKFLTKRASTCSI